MKDGFFNFPFMPNTIWHLISLTIQFGGWKLKNVRIIDNWGLHEVEEVFLEKLMKVSKNNYSKIIVFISVNCRCME